MLADFLLRLAAGSTACLLLLSPAATARPAPGERPVANPVFFRTQFQIALALSCGALLWLAGGAPWPLLALLGAAAALCVAGSVSWALERSPGGVTLIALASLSLAAAVALREWQAEPPPSPGERLAGGLSSALLLGASLSAMLMGHNYLVSPTMSLTPLFRLLAALSAAIVVRLAVEGVALASWRGATTPGDAALWLPVRWGIGLVLPAVLCVLAYLTARIRSTQSATGILYVVVIFCFLGELTGQLLRTMGAAW